MSKREFRCIPIYLGIAQDRNWNQEFRGLIEQYQNKKHPLEYQNLYQLLVMVVLSAQDSDKNINNVALKLFPAYPNMEALAKATEEGLQQYISGVRNFGNKTKWLLSIANLIKEDKNIPLSMDELTALPGIGRKSANVILREAGKPAVGIIVDLHVVRVAPRIGIAEGTDPKKIEAQLMKSIQESDWGHIGMAISFLGRETCRPTNPKCGDCIMRASCAYEKTLR
jgi:endonuclease III